MKNAAPRNQRLLDENPSVPMVKWETEAGESLEAQGPAGLAYAMTNRETISNTVEGMG